MKFTMHRVGYLLGVASLAAGCAVVTSEETSSTAAIGDDLGSRVRDVFDASCASCHHEPGTSGRKFDISDFNAMRSAANKRFIDRDAPAQSPLYARLLDRDEPMPPEGRAQLTDAQKSLVLAWIRAGAPNPAPVAAVPDRDAAYRAAVTARADAFTRSVRPVLQRKCGDCHDSSARGPWYSGLPGIAGDISRGRAAFDFATGFPFNGASAAARVVGDVQNLENTIYENTMPITAYTLAHPSSNLNDSDRNVITRWTHDTIVQLGAFAPRAEGEPAPGVLLSAGQICSVLVYTAREERLEQSIPGHSDWVDRAGTCAEGTTCRDAGTTHGRRVSRCAP